MEKPQASRAAEGRLPVAKRVKKHKAPRPAASPGHKLGQMVGDFIQESVDRILAARLQKLATEHNLYLDRQGLRPVVRGKHKKVRWKDNQGNTHDLNFVLEQGGSAEKQGRAVAFLEAAWRRYTKQTRNKVNEIEGALLPLRESHRTCRFCGVVAVGKWSQPGLEQFRSHGIEVLHISYEDLIGAFQLNGLNLDYAERASPAVKRALVKALERLSAKDMTEIAVALEAAVEDDLKKFLATLEASVTTEITQILIGGVFGRRAKISTIKEAIDWIQRFNASDLSQLDFENFEILLRFKDGREIVGAHFPTKNQRFNFLNSLPSRKVAIRRLIVDRTRDRYTGRATP